MSSSGDLEGICITEMARNMLALPGGNPCDYTAEEFAEAIVYWSKRVAIKEG